MTTENSKHNIENHTSATPAKALQPSKEPKSTHSAKQADVKTSKHAVRYLIIGTSLTIFNYAFYAILANVIIQNNDLLWLSTLIATAITTILAYLLHSKITWKERPITKSAKYKFFIWNAILTVAIGPGFTQLFSIITPLYEFAYGITSAIGLPFTYEFVLTTGAFVLTSAVIMILNFLLYDRFVFGKKSNNTSVSTNNAN